MCNQLSNQLSKQLDTLLKKLSKKYCPLCNILSDNLPKNVVQAMSTVQYIVKQLAKKYCPSHVHCNIFYASVVFLSGLVVGALLIFRLFQSLCFPLVYLSDILSFGFCCLFFLFLVVHHHELLVLVFFLIYIISLITYQKKKKITIIELTIYQFFTYQKSVVFAGKYLYFQHMELVHN